MAKALVFGANGNIGSHLVERLAHDGYEVYAGIYNRAFNLLDVPEQVQFVRFSLFDDPTELLQRIEPHEIFNCAVVDERFRTDREALELSCFKFERAVLEYCKNSPQKAHYLTLTPIDSVRDKFKDEFTLYKHDAHCMNFLYRRKHGVCCSSAVLYNVVSSRSRGRLGRIIEILNEISRLRFKDSIPTIKVGNIYRKLDWLHAADAAKAIAQISRQDEPDEYRLFAGALYSVEEFVDQVFQQFGLSYKDYVIEDLNEYDEAEIYWSHADNDLRNKLKVVETKCFKDIIKEVVRLEDVKG